MSTSKQNSSDYKKVVEEIATEFFSAHPIESHANRERLKSSFDLLELESKITALAAGTTQDRFPQNQITNDQTTIDQTRRDESQAAPTWLAKISSWFRADSHQAYYQLCAVMTIAVMAVWLAPSTFYDGQNQPPQLTESVATNQSIDELELTFQELWLVENELLFSEEI